MIFGVIEKNIIGNVKSLKGQCTDESENGSVSLLYVIVKKDR